MVEKKKEDSMLFKVKESGDKSEDCEQDLIINTDGPYSVRINRSVSTSSLFASLTSPNGLQSTSETFSGVRVDKRPIRKLVGFA